MLDFFNSIFGWLGDLLTSLWKLIKKALPYIMLAIALFLAFSTAGLAIPLLGIVIPAGWLSAAVAMGVAFLLAPEETANMINPAIDAVGNAVSNVVEEAATAVGGAINAVASASGLSSVLLWVGLGVGAYFLLTAGRDKDKKREELAINLSSDAKGSLA